MCPTLENITENEDRHKNDDKSKNEDDLKIEDSFKKEEYPQNGRWHQISRGPKKLSGSTIWRPPQKWK